MNKVTWKTQTRESDTLIKEKTFEFESDKFGGLNFLEFIQYLVYRNGSCVEVSVNDELVWDKAKSWYDDFLAIRTSQVDPRDVLYMGHVPGKVDYDFRLGKLINSKIIEDDSNPQ